MLSLTPIAQSSTWLDDPARMAAAMIQAAVADCLSVYLTRDERDDATLLSYGDHIGNGAVFKRLGRSSQSAIVKVTLS